MRFMCSVCQTPISCSPDDVSAICPQCGQKYEIILDPVTKKMKIKKAAVQAIPESQIPENTSFEDFVANPDSASSYTKNETTNEEFLPPPIKNKKKKKKGGLSMGAILGTVVLLIILISVAAFLVFGGNGSAGNGESSPFSGLSQMLGMVTATPTMTATLPPTETPMPTATQLPTYTLTPTIPLPPTATATPELQLEKVDLIGLFGASLSKLEANLNQKASKTEPALTDSIPLFNKKAGAFYQTTNWNITAVNSGDKILGFIFEPITAISADKYDKVFVSFNLLVDEQPQKTDSSLTWTNIHGYDIDIALTNNNIQTIKIRRNQTGSSAAPAAAIPSKTAAAPAAVTTISTATAIVAPVQPPVVTIPATSVVVTPAQ